MDIHPNFRFAKARKALTNFSAYENDQGLPIPISSVVQITQLIRRDLLVRF